MEHTDINQSLNGFEETIYAGLRERIDQAAGAAMTKLQKEFNYSAVEAREFIQRYVKELINS